MNISYNNDNISKLDILLKENKQEKYKNLTKKAVILILGLGFSSKSYGQEKEECKLFCNVDKSEFVGKSLGYNNLGNILYDNKSNYFHKELNKYSKEEDNYDNFMKALYQAYKISNKFLKPKWTWGEKNKEGEYKFELEFKPKVSGNFKDLEVNINFEYNIDL